MVLGKLLCAFQDFICDEHGHHAWRHIKSGIADEPINGYCPYDDKMLYQLLERGSQLTGIPGARLLEDFGYYFILWAINQGYAPQLHYLGGNLPELLTNLNNLHLHLSHTHPSMQPPNFKCINVTPTSLELHYWSQREGLYPIVPGLLRALSKEIFDMDVLVTRVAGKDMKGEALKDHDLFRVEYPYQAELNNWDNLDAAVRARFQLPSDMFFTLFPFHLLLDSGCKVIQMGSSLQRVVPEMGPGARAHDFLQMYHPYAGWDFHRIQQQLDNCFVLRVLSTGMEIKGQMVVAHHNRETGETSSQPSALTPAGPEDLSSSITASASPYSASSTFTRCPVNQRASQEGFGAVLFERAREGIASLRVNSLSNLLAKSKAEEGGGNVGGRSALGMSSLVGASGDGGGSGGLLPVLLFLGSPRLTNVGDLKKYALHYADVPLHDLNRDYVLLAEQRAADAVLKDKHEKMVQQLTLANQRLEEAHARIAQLEEQNIRLEGLKLKDNTLVQDL